MNAVEERLKARIAAEGPIALDEYMAEANAHYYATRDPLGLAGDFVTAPEISQMFGEMLGAVLAGAWDRAGRPDAVYAELGPGRGTLAADALKVMRRTGFGGQAHLVETSATLREAQAARVPGEIFFHDRIEQLPKRPLLLVANEFLDALPIRQWVGEKERRVTHDGTRFAFTPGGPIRETSPARDAAVSAIASHLVAHGGAALVVDYGFSNGESGDSLQAVRDHCFADPLEAPGEQDLSAHVDFLALAEVARSAGAQVSRVASQGSWLETVGIAARATRLAALNPARTEAIAAARRRLCDDQEMGRLFKVVALRHPDWPEVVGLER